MTAHSLVGGSTAARIIACPGSLKLYRELMPEDEASDYAREGTMLHKVMELVLDDHFELEDLVGSCPTGDIEFTRDHLVEKIQPALRAFERLVDGITAEYGVAPFLAYEHRVEFTKSVPGAFGTADVLGIIPDLVMFTVDWKFGDGVMVEAEENAQGMFYAGAAMETIGMRPPDVRIGIVQPSRDRDPLSIWKTTPARVEQFTDDLLGAVILSKGKTPAFSLGGHCRFCRVKMMCPEQRGGVVQLTETRGVTLSNAALAEMLAKADAIEGIIGEIRKEAHARLEAGQVLPGYKLVPKRATRKWLDDAVAERTLRDAGLRVRDIKPPTLVSPAAAERLLKAKRKGLEILEGIIESKSTGTSVVPADDPRPEVPNVASLAQVVKRFIK